MNLPNDKKEEKCMEKGLQSAAVNHFFDAVLSLENKEECYKFFEDVCTVKEIYSRRVI